MQYEYKVLTEDRPYYRRRYSQYRRITIITFICGSIFVLILCFNSDPHFFSNLKYVIENEVDKYSINTNGCHIPVMEPFSIQTQKYFKNPDIKPCPNTNYSLLFYNGSYIWIDKDIKILEYYKINDQEKLKCCYSSFFRPDNIPNIYSFYIDDRIRYEKCIDFKDFIEVKHEFVRATCSYGENIIYDQYFPFVPFKNLLSDDSDKILNRTEKSGYNILIIGIDNVSRLNFHRTMPKTLSFMKERGAIELIGYNKVGDNSFPNIVPLLMGYAMDEIKEICHPVKTTTFDDCPFLWNLYKEAGYYTAFGEDSGWLGTFNYQMKGFRKTPTDYYLHPFISEAESKAGKYENGNVKLCVNEHYMYQILLDYITAITETLSDHKLFGFFWETTMSHDYLENPVVMDDSYDQFFKHLESSGYIEKTIIFFISDHGSRWGEFRRTRQGFLEERLPMTYVLTPLSFRLNYTEAFDNLQYNIRQLTTPFDLHETLRDLKDLDSIRDENIRLRSQNYANKRGISLFLKIPENRTCQMAGIPDHFCACHDHVALTKTSSKAIAVSERLVKFINEMLKETPKCTELELDEVLDIGKVMLKPKKNENLEVNWTEYTVMVKVKPSGGIFEGTLRQYGEDWSVVGTISRLNLYGKQSDCVHDPRLKLYCYCV